MDPAGSAALDRLRDATGTVAVAELVNRAPTEALRTWLDGALALLQTKDASDAGVIQFCELDEWNSSGRTIALEVAVRIAILRLRGKPAAHLLAGLHGRIRARRLVGIRARKRPTRTPKQVARPSRPARASRGSSRESRARRRVRTKARAPADPSEPSDHVAAVLPENGVIGRDLERRSALSGPEWFAEACRLEAENRRLREIVLSLLCGSPRTRAPELARAQIGRRWPEGAPMIGGPVYDAGDREPFETVSLAEETILERRGVLLRAADVKPEPVKWLWQPYIPLRAVTVLVGDPGLGKSLLTIRLGADLTRGQLLDDPHPVIFSSVEDDRPSVIVPRLIAANANLALASFFLIATKDAGEDSLQIPEDVTELERAVSEKGARLLVIDPVNAQLGPSVENTNSDRHVRRALAPLQGLAERNECAVVVLMHLNKDTAKQTLYRVGGSVGYGGAARSVVGMAAHPAPRPRTRKAPRTRTTTGSGSPRS